MMGGEIYEERICAGRGDLEERGDLCWEMGLSE